MATINRFEELDTWKEARILHQMILPLFDLLIDRREYKLVDQLRGSCGSAMDNIAEGFERGNRKEFILFLGYAKGSVGEIKSQLYRILDTGYISTSEFDKLFQQADKIGKMIYGLSKHLNNSSVKGLRYQNSVKESINSSEEDTQDLMSLIEIYIPES